MIENFIPFWKSVLVIIWWWEGKESELLQITDTPLYVTSYEQTLAKSVSNYFQYETEKMSVTDLHLSQISHL